MVVLKFPMYVSRSLVCGQGVSLRKRGLTLKLKSLKLSNFRHFDAFEVAFDSSLTVLVGDNGSGKSSILDAAAIALSTFFTKFDSISASSISSNDARVVTYRQGSVVDQQAQYPVRIEALGSVSGSADLTWARVRNSAKGGTTVSEAKEMIGASEVHRILIKEGSSSLVLPVLAHYGTARLWGKASRASKAPRLATRFDGYRNSLDAVPNERLMSDWFYRMTLIELQDQARIPELDAVRNALRICFEGITGYSDTSVFFDIKTQELTVSYEIKDTESDAPELVKMPVRIMSDGYRNTLNMIADLAYRMATLNPGMLDDVLSAPGIVLIDEVDLHLHPLWQARILGDLRTIFPNIQFIVTTHSPIVVASVKKDHLRVVSRHGAFDLLNETYGREPGAILTEVMGASRRPSDVNDLFDSFYELLGSDDYASAEEVLCELEAMIGPDDSDLVCARTALLLEQI